MVAQVVDVEDARVVALYKCRQETVGWDNADGCGFVDEIIVGREGHGVCLILDSQLSSKVVQLTEIVIAAQLAFDKEPGLLIPDDHEIHLPFFKVTHVVKFNIQSGNVLMIVAPLEKMGGYHVFKTSTVVCDFRPVPQVVFGFLLQRSGEETMPRWNPEDIIVSA